MKSIAKINAEHYAKYGTLCDNPKFIISEEIVVFEDMSCLGYFDGGVSYNPYPNKKLNILTKILIWIRRAK
jgi:hypothetical protein